MSMSSRLFIEMYAELDEVEPNPIVAHYNRVQEEMERQYRDWQLQQFCEDLIMD